MKFILLEDIIEEELLLEYDCDVRIWTFILLLKKLAAKNKISTIKGNLNKNNIANILKNKIEVYDDESYNRIMKLLQNMGRCGINPKVFKNYFIKI